MSRSRKKYAKAGWCTGSNTEFYRERNRSTRKINKNNLRTLLATKNIDEVAEEVYTIPNNKNPKFDRWNEPTDGSYIVWKDDPEGFWTEEQRKKLLRK